MSRGRGGVLRGPSRRAGALRAAALVTAAALSACLVHEVHRVGPLAEPIRRGEPAVRVLVFGDFGHDTTLQHLVARGMRRAHAAHPFDLALQLGDNLYFCGPDPARPGAEACRFGEDGATVEPGPETPADPLFRVNEAPLEGLRGRDGSPLPIYLALGNHDIGWGGDRCVVPGLPGDEAARRRACLSVAHRTPTWIMPARHYVLDRGPVRLVVVDTNVVVADYAGFTLAQELAFVREATQACSAGRLCFLAGHHPPAAAIGWRAGPSEQRARMARLVAAAGGRARAFFAGHVHTLEHLSLDGLDVFVSGSTAMGSFMPFRYVVPARAQVRFATSAWGWAELEADASGWSVRFVDLHGEPLHCCEAAGDGPCRPVRCT
jgi:3',5'-cyclic AMP phosphodiesterase CpdA